MRVKTFISIGLMLLVMLCAAPVYANGIPTLPHAFYGTVTMNDDPAPDGTKISATVADGDVLTTSQNPIETVNGNYGIDGLHLLVQGYDLSGAITFYVNGVEVEGVTATFEAGGGPTLRDLDLVSDITAQKVETVPAGQTDYVIDFSTEAGTVITVDTIGEVTITVQKYASNPHPGATLPADMLAMFIDISVDDHDNIDWPMHVEYTYTDAEIVGLTESSLVMYYYTAGAWHECSDTGVNTATNTIWANMLSAELTGSPIAFGGAAVAAPVVDGGGGGGGGGGAEITTISLTGLTAWPSLRVDPNGTVQLASQLTSTDGNLILDIAKDTVLLDSAGKALTVLSASHDSFSPKAPAGKTVIAAYNITPNGATFDPAIALTIKYDEGDLPEDCAESDLCICCWDGEKYCDRDTTCNVAQDTSCCQVAHLTTFALIGTITPPAAAPAAFSVSNLTIQPSEGNPEEVVTITINVANSGEVEDNYNVVLKINGEKEAEKQVTVAAGSTEKVSFTVTKREAGSYMVEVDGLSGSFSVAGVPIPAPTPTPTPTPVPKPINWPLIGGIIGGVVVIGLLVFFLVRRRLYY